MTEKSRYKKRTLTKLKKTKLTTTLLRQQLEEAEATHVRIQHKLVNQNQPTKIIKLRILQLKTRTNKTQDSWDNQKDLEITGETKRID